MLPVLTQQVLRSHPHGPHHFPLSRQFHPRGLAMLLLGAVLLAALGVQQFRIDASSDSP